MLETSNALEFKIGEVARQLDIAVETIRMYEREGLLLVHKTDSGQRLFSAADVHWISCIRRLIIECGLNLEGIRRMLAFLPCWELKPCSEAERKVCPAYLNAMKPCWMIKSQLAGACQTFDCRECNVYRSARFCDNLKELLRDIRLHQNARASRRNQFCSEARPLQEHLGRESPGSDGPAKHRVENEAVGI